jgi:hypothetical protein
MQLKQDQIDRLKHYRQQAFQRLKEREHRHYATEEDWRVVDGIVSEWCVNSAIAYQIGKDLRVYLLYDAMAMWLDHDAGLAAYDPETMLRIGEHYFGESDR